MFKWNFSEFLLRCDLFLGQVLLFEVVRGSWARRRLADMSRFLNRRSVYESPLYIVAISLWIFAIPLEWVRRRLLRIILYV